VVANQQAAAKAGILGQSPQPSSKVTGPASTRNLSYDQLAEMAKASIGV
jgi:hypothetical protein